MKVLLAIPHVFAPKKGSLYSSQTEAKRQLKQDALLKATIGNLNRHRQRHWIHASLGKNQQVVKSRIKHRIRRRNQHSDYSHRLETTWQIIFLTTQIYA